MRVKLTGTLAVRIVWAGLPDHQALGNGIERQLYASSDLSDRDIVAKVVASNHA